MADFANLAPGILYSLANGFYDDKEEAAILAATREGRVDDDRATVICEALEPPAPPDSDGGDGNDGGGDDDAEDGGGKAEDAPAEDAETKQILDGPPPAMPPAPDPTPTNYALQSFDDAVSQLKRLSTKPLPTFADTKHSADDLEGVERLLGSVITHKRSTSTQAATQVGDDVFLKMSRNQSENPDQTD
jgi:hypothetical protein